MKILLYIFAAICGYVVAGINPAIVISKAVYHKDIRECGSGNPGFTNFKRTFGNKWAWWVLLADLAKAAVVTAVFAWLFGKVCGDRQLGAAYTGLFCMLGHAFPFWFGFKGGKGFLVCLSTMFVIDWRVGAIAALVMCILLLTTKYMSLSTVTAILLCPVLLVPFGASVYVVCIAAACAVFMAVRHKENFRRLINGTESKFYFKSKDREQKSDSRPI